MVPRKKTEIEINKNYILDRYPFLLRGVIVQYKSLVKVKCKESTGFYTVIYKDKEGFDHEISNIEPHELLPHT